MIENEVNTLTCLHTGIEILDVTQDELIVGIVKKHVHLRFLTSREVIKSTDFVTHVENSFTKVAADESSTTRYEELRALGKFEMLVSHYFLLFIVIITYYLLVIIFDFLEGSAGQVPLTRGIFLLWTTIG